MVDWNLITGIFILIMIILVIGALIGWMFAKLKMKLHIRKIEKRLKDPEELKHYLKLKEEQDKSDIERGIINNDRRNKVGDIKREFYGIRKQGNEKFIDSFADYKGTKPRRELSIPEDTPRESEDRNSEPDKPELGEDKQEFDWSR
jgi:hypothetical protein